MMALTLHQPWASLIMIGAKSHEFRPWRLGPANRRVPIVMHAAARRVVSDDVNELLEGIVEGQHNFLGHGDRVKAAELLERWRYDPAALPLGAALGTVVFGDPVRAADEFTPLPGYSQVDPAIWAWPVIYVEPWPEPVPASGSQGLWRWRGPVPAMTPESTVPTGRSPAG